MENSRNFAGTPHLYRRVAPTLRGRWDFPRTEVCLSFRARLGPPLNGFYAEAGAEDSQAENLAHDLVLIENPMEPRSLVVRGIEREPSLGFG